MQQRLSIFLLWGLAGYTSLVLTGCGFLFEKDLEKYDAAHGGKLSASSDQDLTKSPVSAKRVAATTVPAIECSQEKNNQTFVAGVTEILFGRTINDEEKKMANESGFNREDFISGAIENSEASSGYTKFIQNLLQLNKIKPSGGFNNGNQQVLIGYLKQEPVVKILRNIDKPWSYFFTFKKFYCTPETAEVYGIPSPSSSGFEVCEFPSNRAGLLGMASVLRAHPSTMFSSNNNYHRLAFAYYLATGIRMLDQTDTPHGGEKGTTMASCVPKSDLRVMEEGTVYGSAAIPNVDGTCASCHSNLHAGGVVAFRQFNENGQAYTFDAVDRTNENTFRNLGMTRGLAKALLNEQDSCISINGEAIPRKFQGLPGLGRVIAESGTLGKALGIQVPQNLANIQPDGNMKASIQKAYEDGEGTLKDAIKGFFLSDSFQCASKVEK